MLKVNGYAMSMGSITSVILLIVWLAGISFRVDSNAEEIEAQKTEVRAAQKQRTAVEKSVIAITKDVEFIKEKLTDQGKTLDKILDKLNES